MAASQVVFLQASRFPNGLFTALRPNAGERIASQPQVLTPVPPEMNIWPAGNTNHPQTQTRHREGARSPPADVLWLPETLYAL